MHSLAHFQYGNVASRRILAQLRGTVVLLLLQQNSLQSERKLKHDGVSFCTFNQTTHLDLFSSTLEQELMRCEI
jgi:hypothetical protein